MTKDQLSDLIQSDPLVSSRTALHALALHSEYHHWKLNETDRAFLAEHAKQAHRNVKRYGPCTRDMRIAMIGAGVDVQQHYRELVMQLGNSEAAFKMVMAPKVEKAKKELSHDNRRQGKAKGRA